MKYSPAWEANRSSASQESFSFPGTRRFITTFTSARHPFLSWASSIQSINVVQITLSRSVFTAFKENKIIFSEIW